jgi:hypothetical protein
MTGQPPPPTRDEVLDAFAVEPDHGRDTLERYLRAYPAFAADLVDLSLELSRPIAEDIAPLSPADAARIDTAWLRHRAAAPGPASAGGPPVGAPGPVADPLAALSIADLRVVARDLGVPRQVLTAFRERRVDLASVPHAFLVRMAKAIQSTFETLRAALAQPAALTPGWNYKSDTKPSGDAPVPFERLLRDAGVPDAEVAALLTDEG